MNKVAFDFLKDLQQQLTSLLDDQESKLKDIDNEVFKDDVSDNIFGRIDDVLYEIETIMSDVEEGYYSNNKKNFYDETEDFEDF